MESASEELAPIPFRILKCCGLWRPLTWRGWRKLVYSLYTVVAYVTLVTIAMLMMLGVFQMPVTDDLFAENVFFMCALINATFKATNILVSRDLFIRMLRMSQEDRWYKLRNPEEMEIRERYSKTIRKISLYFTTAVFVSILLRVVTPLLDFSGEVKLPVNTYCPCNISATASCYWSLYWHQVFGTGLATLIHAAKDSLISAHLLQTCCNLDILKNRILNIADTSRMLRTTREASERAASDERSLIAECVRDHESIFKFAKVLNDSLNMMLYGQIATTMPNLCLSIYLLSTQSVASMEFMMTFQFFSAVVIELFFFCWYGNEVTLHSLDVESAVYEVDWTILNNSSKKDLLMIMLRTSKPILFSVGPIMNMNIESFLSIMKSSYSAFNVLQSTGK